MTGYIKDHRKELGSDIWLMPPLYHRVWQYLKYKVNHEEAEIPMRDGTKFKILPGQHLTSVRGIAKGIGWYEGRVWKEPNPKTIDTILKWLEKTLMISIDSGRGNRQYTLITLLQWALYQSTEDWGNSKVTVGKQSAGINKNDKNVKEEKIKHLDFVYLTEKQYLNLIEILGADLEGLMFEMNVWLANNPAKQKTTDCNLTLQNWHRRRKLKTMPKKEEKPRPKTIYDQEDKLPQRVIDEIEKKKKEREMNPNALRQFG